MEKVQYKKSDFYYDLPEERIAQTPATPRDSSRLLVYDRKEKKITDRIFRDITEYLQAGDVLVVNNTKVIPARAYALTPHGGVVEILLLKRYDLNTWEVLMRPGKKGKIGAKYFMGLIIAPYFGWTLGTLAGAVLGNVLPAIVCNALGVALYAMFIAIVIPEMKKARSMFLIVSLAVMIRCAFYWIPFLREHVSDGFAVIICAVVASGIGAAVFPLADEPAEQGVA